MAERTLYLFYLISWKKSHFGKGFKGCSPACYNEWYDSELQEMLTHPEWYTLSSFTDFLIGCVRKKIKKESDIKL